MGRAGGEADLRKRQTSRERRWPQARGLRCDGICDLEFSVNRDGFRQVWVGSGGDIPHLGDLQKASRPVSVRTHPARELLVGQRLCVLVLRPAWDPGLVRVVPEETRATYSEGYKDALLGSRCPRRTWSRE